LRIAGATPYYLNSYASRENAQLRINAISHADGSVARPPIALCEVQGYVYAAYTSIAWVATQLGRDELAARLNQRAAALRSRFSDDFWLEPERTVPLALDGDKRPCRVMSNAVTVSPRVCSTANRPTPSPSA
jgi:glycogen debranching enzyme